MSSLFDGLGSEKLWERFLGGFVLFILILVMSYLLGWALIPEGALRELPIPSLMVFNENEDIIEKILKTFAYNLFLMLLITGSNLFRVKRFPLGFLPFLANVVILGLFAGSNSFSGDVSSRTLEGIMLFFKIGFLEFMSYLMIASATANMSIYYSEKWRGEEFKKIKDWKEIVPSRGEISLIFGAIVVLMIAAFNEWMVVTS